MSEVVIPPDGAPKSTWPRRFISGDPAAFPREPAEVGLRAGAPACRHSLPGPNQGHPLQQRVHRGALGRTQAPRTPHTSPAPGQAGEDS